MEGGANFDDVSYLKICLNRTGVTGQRAVISSSNASRLYELANGLIMSRSKCAVTSCKRVSFLCLKVEIVNEKMANNKASSHSGFDGCKRLELTPRIIQGLKDLFASCIHYVSCLLQSPLVEPHFPTNPDRKPSLDVLRSVECPYVGD